MDGLTIVFIILIIFALIGGVLLGYFFTNRRYQTNLASLEEIQNEHNEWEGRLKSIQNELWETTQRLDNAKTKPKLALPSTNKPKNRLIIKQLACNMP